jgi:hypothetical protein
LVLPSGSANGVAYLNGSKVVTSGSALWFDGTNFGVGTGGNTLNQQSVIYKAGANAVYQQVANGSTGLGATNGIRVGLTSAGVGEWYSPTAAISYIDNTEQMRLTSTGLGIGTSSPAYKLDVYGSGTPVAAVRSSSSGDAKLYLECAGTNSGYVAYNRSLQALTFSANNSINHAILDSSGNLGLGVTPSAGGYGRALQVFDGSYGGAITAQAIDTNYYPVNLTANAVSSGAYSWKYVNGASSSATRYEQVSGIHRWFNAPSGTAGNAISFSQAMTLDASGNLGIGTTSPSQRLNVVTTSGNCYTRVDRASQSTGQVGYQLGGGTSSTDWLIYMPASSNDLVFFGNSAERARIDSSGKLIVGATSSWSPPAGTAANIFQPNGYATGNSSTSANFQNDRIAFSYGQFYVLNNSSTGVVLTNGSTAWAAQSDERTKDIIEPITNAANKVATLRAVIGKYKNDEDGIRRSFLIAQDVQAVLPEAVSASDDEIGTLNLRYSEVIPLLVAAMQEQQAIIESLKARLDAANL